MKRRMGPFRIVLKGFVSDHEPVGAEPRVFGRTFPGRRVLPREFNPGISGPVRRGPRQGCSPQPPPERGRAVECLARVAGAVWSAPRYARVFSGLDGSP